VGVCVSGGVGVGGGVGESQGGGGAGCSIEWVEQVELRGIVACPVCCVACTVCRCYHCPFQQVDDSSSPPVPRPGRMQEVHVPV
jgi:hypothetical protein